jgi:hypothetical protein
MTLDLESDNLAVLEPGDRRLRGQTNESTASFSVPVVLRPGTATLSATLSAGYCRDGEEALCFVARMELRLPIQVAADLPATEPHLEITLPER